MLYINEDILTIATCVFCIVVVSLIFGLASKIASEERGYTGGFWWGFIFWVIGLFIVSLKPHSYIVYTNKLKILDQLYEDGYIDEKKYRKEKDNLYYNFYD